MSKILKVDSEAEGEEEQRTTILCLPPEALSAIFSHLKVADRGRAAQVCSTWKVACYNNIVWRDVLYPWSHELMLPDSVLFKSIVQRGIRRIRLTNDQGLGLDQVAGNFPSLLTLELTMCCRVTDATIPATLLQKIPNLTELSLLGCDLITDAGVKHIADNLKKLVSLNLTRCMAITDASLLAIATGLKKLTSLDLHWCNAITDVGIGYLTQFCDLPVAPVPKLVFLELFDCRQLTDRSLFYLRMGQPTIRRLNLQFCVKLTDVGLENLAKMGELRELHLPNASGIGNDGLQHLCGNSKLQELIFDRANITDFSPLVKMTSLRMLTFDGCPGLNDDGLEHLGKMTSLDTLYLSYCSISNAGLEHLANSDSRIVKLELSLCLNITDDCLRHVARMKHLYDLSLIFCRSIGGEGLAHLSEGEAKITILELQSFHLLDQRSIGHVMQLTHLQSLSLKHEQATPDVLDMVAAGLPNLKTFKVDRRNRIGDILKLRINTL